jgi:hypothetical protein
VAQPAGTTPRQTDGDPAARLARWALHADLAPRRAKPRVAWLLQEEEEEEEEEADRRTRLGRRRRQRRRLTRTNRPMQANRARSNGW